MVEERRFRGVNDSDSEQVGIIIIHQELALIPLMSIAENIFFVASSRLGTSGVIDRRCLSYRRTQRASRPGRPHRDARPRWSTDLGVGKQQLVEIAKALSKRGPKLLILDEPTASLNEKDSDAPCWSCLLGRSAPKASPAILISHKLNGGRQVSPTRITVLRDGAHRRQHRLPGLRPVEEDRDHPQHGRSRPGRIAFHNEPPDDRRDRCWR